jgi:hypothetical protein
MRPATALVFNTVFIGRIFRQQRSETREVPWPVVGPARERGGDVEGSLAVRMASAAIVAHFTRSHLMPGLRHRQNQTVLVQHLKSEWGCRREFEP